MQKFIKKMKKGFTIMELVIVIAVIAILAAVLIPTFSNITDRANESAAMQEARNEWTNFSVEVATDPAQDNDFMVIHTNDSVQTIFVVIDGQFDVDPVTDVSLTTSGSNYTFDEKNFGGTNNTFDKATLINVADYNNYQYGNTAVKIYKLSNEA